MMNELNAALSGMILSASGWRGVFASDGSEESAAREISPAHATISAAAAKAFSAYLSQRSGAALPPGAILVGRDTRPTGEAIADAVICALLSIGREVYYTGIAAAPEIMAYARSFSGENAAHGADGFIYITASHNPIGYNGLKFGLVDGGILPGSENAHLVSLLKEIIASPDDTRIKNINPDAVYALVNEHKQKAIDAYREFTFLVISMSSNKTGKTESDNFFNALKQGLKKRHIGIAADFNGSSRSVSIDRDFLTSLGIDFYSINGKPGEIVHKIVPEGESLEPCRRFVEKLSKENRSQIIGYMPDCDGDRGNLIFFDEIKNEAKFLSSQEVFALVCVAELSFLVWSGKLQYDENGKALTKAAIVVNDPTSMRIEEIAAAFDVRVFRAEVGEANIVTLARKLREEGYLVRILGEGSNGGSIIYPSSVRDPLNTLVSFARFLALDLFRIWLRFAGKLLNNPVGMPESGNYPISVIIASFPAYITTEVYDNIAQLKVNTPSHALLKSRYQKIFLREWEKRKKEFREEYSIAKWEAIAYNGITESRSIANFGDAGSGGLKIEFSGPGGEKDKEKKIAFIWMRGSGTESVFRIIADAAGIGSGGLALRLEKDLIEWQRQMVMEADMNQGD